VSHQTHLAMKQLSSLAVINKIENLLQSLNAYFGSSPKRHLEFQKLAKLLYTKETQDNQASQNSLAKYVVALTACDVRVSDYCCQASKEQPRSRAEHNATKCN
jgi:hypothetical protein